MFTRLNPAVTFPLLLSTLALGVVVWASPASTPPAAASADAPAAPAAVGESALILIEFQKEWLGEQGKLVRLFDRPDRGRAAAERAKVALHAAREAGMTVIHAPMILSAGYPELGDGKYGLRAAIPKAGTWIGQGAAFADGFEPREAEPVVRGRVGASAFVGSDLQEILRKRGITTIYLAGFATHVCVESTMRHGHDLAYDVIVLRDACAAFNDEQDAYFDEHVLHHFAHAESVDAFIAALESASATGE
jgi:nicotinamidase-related amidase